MDSSKYLRLIALWGAGRVQRKTYLEIQLQVSGHYFNVNGHVLQAALFLHLHTSSPRQLVRSSARGLRVRVTWVSVKVTWVRITWRRVRVTWLRPSVPVG